MYASGARIDKFTSLSPGEITYIDDFHLLPEKSKIRRSLASGNLVACATVFPTEIIKDTDILRSNKQFGNSYTKLSKMNTFYD